MKSAATYLVLLSIIEEIAAQCPIVTPQGVWEKAAVHQAVAAGKFQGGVPPKGQGFNRTMSMKGLCTDDFTLSTGFSCGASSPSSLTAGFRAVRKSAAVGKVSLHFADSECPLTAISIYKTVKADNSEFAAEMRFEFEGCTASGQSAGTSASSGSSTDSAAVVLGLRPDSVSGLDISSWASSICYVATTTKPPTVPPSAVGISNAAVEQKVGVGRCDGVALKKLTTISTEEDCRLRCHSETSMARILNKAECSGYAFNKAASPSCITYQSTVTKADSTAGWKCYNVSRVSAHNAGFSQVTKSTTTAAPVSFAGENLGLHQYLGESTTAYVQQISPPANSPSCFKPLSWFTLQEVSGEMKSIPVSKADWQELMAYLPEPKKSPSHVSAPQIIDRVLVNTCTPEVGWSHHKCLIVPAAVDQSHCNGEELTATMFSGVATAILTWLFVATWYFLYLNICGRKSGYAAAPQEDGGANGAQVCSQIGFQLGMVIVAFGGALLACRGSMHFLDAVLGSSGCYNSDELRMVHVSVMLSAALAVVILCIYLATHLPHHEHTLTGKAAPLTKETKLMLVEVADGQNAAQAVSESIAATSENTPQGQRFLAFSPEHSYMASR